MLLSTTKTFSSLREHIKYVAIVIFFQSGITKGILSYYFDDSLFDITLISLLVFVTLSIANLKNLLNLKSIFLAPLVILSVLIVWQTISGLFSLSHEYSQIKTLLIFLNLFSFISPLLFRRFDLNVFLSYFKLILFFNILIYFPILIIYSNGLLSEDYRQSYAQYLMIAFYLGIFSLLNLQSKGNRPLHSITSLVVIFALGARATALFLFTALFLLYSFFSKKIKNRKRISTSGKIYVLLIASSLIFCLVINLPDLYPQVEAIVERSISRFTVLGSDNSTEERYEHYSFVMSKLNGNLNSLIFGYGTGSYGILFEGSEERIYPHNIFLELLIENGIIGFSIFLLFIAVLIVSILANRNGEFKVVLLLFILANISKSFSLVDIRFVFFIFSIMLIPKNAK